MFSTFNTLKDWLVFCSFSKGNFYNLIQLVYIKNYLIIFNVFYSCMFGINDEGNKVEQRSSSEKFVPKLLKLMKDYDSYVKKWSC